VFLGFLFLSLSLGGSYVKSATIPDRVDGQELNNLYGWWAAIYPNWPFVPSLASVWPVPSLWTPSASWNDLIPQSPLQIQRSAQQLTNYGSALDIIEFNPNADYPDFVQWKQGYFAQIASLGRVFMLGYEHIHGTRFRQLGVSDTGAPTFDMSDPYNRAIFTQDIDFMFREVIVPYLDYYVTSNGRAVIYLWSTENMLGDFGSLLNEVKARYPVFFIGSEWHEPKDDSPQTLARFDAMDGFMGYSVLDPDNEGNYSRAMTQQYWSSLVFRNYLRDYETSHPGKYRLFIPTFQAAFDDSHFPGRSNPDGSPKTVPMYPRTREELFGAAQGLKTAIAQDHIYDNYGPMVIYNELFEGAAVIESQPYAAPAAQYHGFGLDRLAIVKQFFAP
jgi:hypothetical protein